MNELETKIIESAIQNFAEKGLKFTMDDVAKDLKISKKTLYAAFSTKEEMLLSVVEFCYSDIKRCEREIADNPNLNVVEKLRQIMIVLPDRYQNIGLSNMNSLAEKYPSVYKRIEQHLASDWDATIAILQQGIDEGKFRTISIPIMQTMFESTIQSFMSTNVLIDNHLSYEQGLQHLIEIILQGILIPDNDNHQ